MTREQIRSLAEKLNVKDEDVSEMETRLSGHDIALENQHDDDDDNFAPIAYLSSEQTEPTRVLEAKQHDRLQSEGLTEALDKLDARSKRIIEARWLKMTTAVARRCTNWRKNSACQPNAFAR